MTTYEYDGNRLVRAVTVREPEWLEEDLDWARAQMQDEANRCPGCGLPANETVGEHNEGKFVSPPPASCHACEALAVRKKEWEQFDSAGKLFRVHRRDES